MGVVALPHAPASATTARRRIVAELAIVAAIACDWGAEEDGRGLRTWATIDLVAAAGR
jgi:hypothetical protein